MVGMKSEWVLDYQYLQTDYGERRIVTLKDGSSIALNGATRVLVDYNAAERVVILEKGEVVLKTVDAQDRRPFFIFAGPGRILARADGTRVDVLIEQNKCVTVSVLCGEVEVTTHNESFVAAAPNIFVPTLTRKVVVAGNATSYADRGQALPVDPQLASRIRIASWRAGPLRFDNWPVSDLIQEHNYHTQTSLELENAEVGAQQVSGIFQVGNTWEFLQALRAILPELCVTSRGGKSLLLSIGPPLNPQVESGPLMEVGGLKH
jgi:transmembrane sensor